MNEDYLARYLVMATQATMDSAFMPLVVAAVVGFLVALFQGVTQIQDQSLPLTLKILAVGTLFLMFGGSMAAPIIALADDALRTFPMASR